MRLPKPIWKILRSKRLHRALMVAPFALILGLTCWYWQVNRWGDAKLEKTRARLEGLGIQTTEGAIQTCPSLLKHPEVLRLSPTGCDPFEILKLAGVPNPDWLDFLSGNHAHPRGDLRILDPKAAGGNEDEALARRLLDELDTTDRTIQPVVDAMADPTIILDSGEDKLPQISQWSVIRGVCNYLALRSTIRAKAGRLDAAIDDFSTVADFARKWQDQSENSLHSVMLYSALRSLTEAAPILVEAVCEQPEHLQTIDRQLASIDRIEPILHGIEADMGYWFLHFFNDHRSATTLSASDMSWTFDWGDSWDDWKLTLGDWWWQLRPVGHFKAELSDTIEHYLDHLTRTPSGALRREIKMADVKSCRDQLDRAHPLNRHTGFAIHTNIIGGCTPIHLQLHATRWVIACERYRIQHGSYPRHLDELTPDILSRPLESPVRDEPMTMTRSPNGRLTFETADTLSATTFEFTYPANP